MDEKANDMKRGLFRHLVRLCVCVTLIGGALALMGNTGCQTMNRPPSIEDGTELESALRGFHKNLRWARYEKAAYFVAEDFKQSFLGRYEEHGEDFHITLLEIKDLEMKSADREKEEPVHAIVDVEQHWYKEPNMTVQKERFIERWDRQQSGWRLVSRMEKDEWRELQKEKKEAESKTDEEGSEEKS